MHTDFASIVAQLGALSYLGVFGTALLANVVVPVPEEIVMMAFGYISRAGNFDITFLLFVISLGLLVSDIGMFLLSRHNNKIVRYFYNQFFARFFKPHTDNWVSTHIAKIVFFSRFMVQLRFLGPFLAGQHKMKLRDFLLYDSLAIVLYTSIYFFIGRFFHHKISLIAKDINFLHNILLIVIVLIILLSFSRIAKEYFTKYLNRIFGQKTNE